MKSTGGGSLKLVELHRAENDQNSLFVDNTVRKDGVVYLCTPCDPNFLLLAMLTKEESRWVPLQQILQTESLAFPQCKFVMQCVNVNVEALVDVDSGNGCVRINANKTMEYLKSRTNRLVTALISQYQSTASKTQTFNQTSLTTSTTTVLPPSVLKECQRTALQMVCDYIPAKWKELLKQEYALESNRSTATAAAASSSWEESNGYAIAPPSTNHLRFGTQPDRIAPTLTVTSTNNNNKKLKPSTPAVLTAQQKRDQKGTKPLSSFFTKKE